MIDKKQGPAHLSFKTIAVQQLVRGEHQPRKTFDEQSLQALAETIKAVGILMPLLVKPLSGDRYEIIAGERRWRAAQLVGLDTLPCVVSEHSAEQSLMNGLIENMSREDLNPIEEAHGMAKLIEEFGFTHEAVAKVFGKSRSEISNRLRLLKLDPRLHTLLIAGDLTEAHARLLLGLPQAEQYPIAREAIMKGWSSRGLERALQKQLKKNPASSLSKMPDLLRLERQLSEQFATPINIVEQGKGQGHIRVKYNSLEELEGILERWGWKDE